MDTMRHPRLAKKGGRLPDFRHERRGANHLESKPKTSSISLRSLRKAPTDLDHITMAFVFAAATSLLPANQCHALAKISMRCTPAMNAAERRDARNSFGMQPGMQPGFDMRGGGYDMPGGGGGHQRGGGYDMPDGGMHGGFMPGMQGGFGPMQGGMPGMQGGFGPMQGGYGGQGMMQGGPGMMQEGMFGGPGMMQGGMMDNMRGGGRGMDMEGMMDNMRGVRGMMDDMRRSRGMSGYNSEQEAIPGRHAGMYDFAQGAVGRGGRYDGRVVEHAKIAQQAMQQRGGHTGGNDFGMPNQGMGTGGQRGGLARRLLGGQGMQRGMLPEHMMGGPQDSPSGMPWPGMMEPRGMQGMEPRMQLMPGGMQGGMQGMPMLPGGQGMPMGMPMGGQGMPMGMPGGMFGRRDMQRMGGMPGGDFGRGRDSDYGRG